VLTAQELKADLAPSRFQAYLIEVANVRHEHEIKVWRDVKLPAGKS
jgi:hypothetical protein